MLDRQAAVGALSREGIVFRLLTDMAGNSILYPIHHPRVVSSETLVGVKEARRLLFQNLSGMRAGLPPLPTLIEGFRGTGKTSLAIAGWQSLNTPPHPPHFSPCHLIQISREGINDIVPLLDILAETTSPAILLIDDLYFREGDPLLNTFRGILDGGIMEFPNHVALIVTSNHRHLLEERLSQREDALRGSELLDETMALSDRFGLTISTSEPSREIYMQIVLAKLLEEGIISRIPDSWETQLRQMEQLQWNLSSTNPSSSSGDLNLELVFELSTRFARERGSRSGRTATLFAKKLKRGLLEGWETNTL